MSKDKRVEVIIEVPKGSRNKYEIDHETGAVWLDRHLFTATAYPTDYGYIEDTLGEDGDPLDALVLMNEKTFPGVHLWARPIGVFDMDDEAGRDTKILCVIDGDPRWNHIQDVGDIDPFLMNEIRHFFEVYKALEPGKESAVGDWRNVTDAWTEIDDAQKRHIDTH